MTGFTFGEILGQFKCVGHTLYLAYHVFDHEMDVNTLKKSGLVPPGMASNKIIIH